MVILLLNVSVDIHLNIFESQLTIVCDQVAIDSIVVREHENVTSTSIPSSPGSTLHEQLAKDLEDGIRCAVKLFRKWILGKKT